MEVVGGVTSIITLIEATGVLAEVSKNLVLRWRDAPHEIQALATRLSLLAAELQSIKNATARSHPVLTDAIIRQSLGDLLTDVRKRLTKLESLHFRLQQQGPTRQKIGWVAKAGSVEKMLSKTQEVEQRLANLMTLISMRAQTPILEGLDRIEQMVSTLVIALPGAAPISPATSLLLDAAYSNTPSRTGSGSSVVRTLASSPWTLNKSWESWGLRGSLVTTRKGPIHEHNINFSFSTPLARILGGYTLMGSLSLQSIPFLGNAFTFRHPSYFAVARVVDPFHPFMSACRDGDIETVRSMLRSGEGRLTDVSPSGRTPMFYAVQDQRLQVIAELLDCGADVDAVVDSDMSTALICASQERALDVIRFLLQRGASTDLVDRAGSEAIRICWHVSDHDTRYSSADVFNVLVEESHFEANDNPSHRLPVLHNVAIDGNGAQIHSLVRLGCDAHLQSPLAGFAIDFAVLFGNFSAYSALASYYDEHIFQTHPKFASQLLYETIAGKTRHLIISPAERLNYFERSQDFDRIMMDILQRGIDPKVWIQRSVVDAGLTLAGMEDPEMQKLAAATGPDTEAWYLSMLQNCDLISAHENIQRLRELVEAGHFPADSVYGCEEEPDRASFGVHSDSEEGDEASGLSEGNGEGDIRIEPDDETICSAADEADEHDEFWDAEEVV